MQRLFILQARAFGQGFFLEMEMDYNIKGREDRQDYDGGQGPTTTTTYLKLLNYRTHYWKH